MNRQKAVEAFRARVLELIYRGYESRSAFAARVGMDRSTLSQLLSPDTDRLPRAETVIAIARAEQVSCDWLLGLAQDEQEGTELVRADMEIEADAGSPMDERLARWHKEATGYNKHVARLLAGRTRMPKYLPDYYGIGDKNARRLLFERMERFWDRHLR